MEDRVVIYCRESRDEGGEKRERIAFQKKMLEEYAEENKLGRIVRVIVDDDMTGTDFSRLEGIRAMVRAGDFNILLIKDSSRLGRNLTESLLFIDFLEKNGIKLIFRNQPFHPDFFPLEAWFNEMRAKEDSRKIRDVVYRKMERAEYLIAAPYGYQKDRGRLLPREDEAGAVRTIFRTFLEGASTGAIARKMEACGYKTPSQDKNRKDAAQHWSAASIRRILSDEVYTGKLILKKTVGRSFKDKSRMKVPDEEKIFHAAHHTALITEDDYRRAVERLRKTGRGKGKDTPFAGLLFCGGCGRELIFRQRNGESFWVCSSYHRRGKKVCLAHRLLWDDVCSVVRGASLGLMNTCPREENVRRDDRTLAMLYEDLAAGHMNRNEFCRLRESLLQGKSESGTIPDPRGFEAEIAPLVLETVKLYEAGEGNFTERTLLCRLTF